MKKIVLELAKIVLFFIILWWVIVHITYILRNDTDEKENLMGFYAEEKNSLDAVFIGSSTMWASLNPLVMYNERGFTSYNIATSAQRPSSLKYLIKEAQKYQSDTLYVIDVSNFVYDQSVWEEQNEGSLRRVTDGLKYSWNRFLCNYEQIKGKSNKISYYFDIIKYHSEYRNFFHNISHWNFEKENTSKGWLYNDSVEVVSYTWNQKSNVQTNIDEKAEEELYQLINFCDNSNAKYLFIFSMSTVLDENKSKYISDIINSRGYDVFNFNDYWKEIGMDETMDFYNAGHTNLLGAEKISKYFANYLDEKYQFPDNQDDSWNELAKYMENIILDGKNKIYSGNYIGEVKVKVDNIDNDEITFVNNTNCPQSLLYAWYVNEKRGEDYECIYQQWYTTENTFQYQFSEDKEYSVITFVKGSENEALFKYKEVAIIHYDYQSKEWVIELY